MIAMTQRLSKSKLYSSNGELIEINKTINGIPFFRKEYYNDNNNEIDIVTMLKCNPTYFKHIVKIYHVDYGYYDAELVQTSIQFTEENVNQIIDDMKHAKEELQSKGIMYIDWKSDNLGYSITDNLYKLFDFDSSGIANCKSWIKMPPHRWLYKKAIEKSYTSPIDIDNECFNIFCKELKEQTENKDS